MLNFVLPPKIGRIKIYSELQAFIHIDTSYISCLVLKNGNIKKEFFKELSNENTKKIVFERDEFKSSLIEILTKIGAANQNIHLSISPEIAFFKEIKVPFNDNSMIKKILPFELESKSLFPIEDLLFDFLNFSQNNKSQDADILVASIKKHDVLNLQTIFKETNSLCAQATIDTFFLSEHLMKHGIIQPNSELFLVLELKKHSIVCTYIYQNAVLSVKSADVHKDSFKLDALAKDLFFHAESLLLKFNKNISSSKIIILSEDEQNPFLHDASSAMEKQFGTKPSSLFLKNFLQDSLNQDNLAKINKTFETKSHLASKPSLAFSYRDKFENFNLCETFLPNAAKKIVLNQIIFSLMLVMVFSAFIITLAISKLSNLEDIVKSNEELVFKELKKTPYFNYEQKKRKPSLKVILSEAKEQIETKFALQKSSTYDTPNSVIILMELTRLLDRTRFGVSVDTISIKSLPGFEANIMVSGSFDKSKSSVPLDDFTSFSRVISLSKRFTIASPIKNVDEKTFSLTLKFVANNENL